MSEQSTQQEAGREREEAVFGYGWPEGLDPKGIYQVLCDDKGRNGGSWLRVMIAQDGDVHVAMQEWEDMPEGRPHPIPGIRVRTGFGGGRNRRTRMALLWLARAIQLDAAERGGCSNIMEEGRTPTPAKEPSDGR